MPVSQMAEVVRHLRRMLLRQAGGSTDAQLLEQFVMSREETALESLVLRHGPMVWGVCRRILRNHHDAEDAFQATFLVLTRKAASISPRDMLGNWLHGVAQRTALNGRALAARRSVHEVQVPVLPEPEARPDAPSELRAVLDDAVSRLPANYRAVIVLCGLEGRTRTEAAEQLGVSEGTIASRLSRAKSLLAKRLIRGGVSLSVGASAALLTGPVWSETMPPLLKVSTVKAGLAFSAGQSLTSCGVSAAAADLVKGSLKMMATKKLMFIAAIVLLTATLGSGIVYLATGSDAGRVDTWRFAKRQASAPVQPKPRDVEPVPATLVTQVGHGSAYWDYVPCLALSEDGKLLVTGGYLGACLWETATGREIRSFRGSEIHAVALSKDAKLLATAGGQGVIHLWDVDTGKEIRVFDQMWVTVLAFSSDGKQLVAGGTKVVARESEGVVRSWNVQTGKELHVFEQKQKTMNTDLHALAISHDCKWLFAGVYSDLGEIQLWNLNTGAAVRTFPGPWDVQGVAVSSDDKQVVTTNSEGTTRVWDLASGKELRSFGKPEKRVEFEERVTSMAMSADGKWLLTAKQDRSVDVWELATGKRVRTVRGNWKRFQFGPEKAEVHVVIPVVMNGDGKWFITAIGSPDKNIQMWNAATGAPIRAFEGLANPANHMALSDDNKWLVTTGEENTCRLWDLSRGGSVRTFRGHKSRIECVALSRDNKWLVSSSGGSDPTARLWDLATGNEIHVFDHPGQNFVSSVAISHDTKLVATGTYFGAIILWDRLTGKQVLAFPKKESLTHVNSMVFTSDNKRLVVGAVDGAHLLDVSTGKEIRFFQRKNHVHWQVFLSADDKWLVTSAGDQTLRATNGIFLDTGPTRSAILWDLETGKEIRSFPGCSWTMALCRDGKWLITGDNDTARLWDVATGKEIRAFPCNTSQITGVALTRDGKKLLTAGATDCSVRLWDLDTGKELCRLVSFKDGSWATYDPAGRYDSPNGGDVKGLHWTVGNETRPLSQYRGQFYNPGLLAKYMGFNQEASRNKEKSQDTSDDAKYLVEAEKRAEAFLTAVKTAKDPVALAIPLVKASYPEARAALYVLFGHVDDPRVEPILLEVAQSGPHVRRGLITLAGEANQLLVNIVSMREQAKVLDGAQTPEAKVAKIRAYIESHPDLLKSQNYLLLTLMATAREAEDAGAPSVFDLVLQSGCFNNKDAVRYAQKLIDHARKLGADKTLASPDLLDWVIFSEHKDGLPLIREWLKSATDKSAIEKLVKSLRYFPDARESFSALLNDPRPEVVRAAIWQLYFGFADEKSLEAIRKASERRRQAGAPASEMDQYSGIIRTLETNLAATKKGNGKP